MTINQFANATGFCPSYIRNACRMGKIPCDMWYGAYEIPQSLVDVWRAKRHAKTDRRTIKNSVSAYQQALDRYNDAHGTCYSYGMAVHLGILDED